MKQAHPRPGPQWERKRDLATPPGLRFAPSGLRPAAALPSPCHPSATDPVLLKRAERKAVNPASHAKGQGMHKNTICLWYDKDAEEAARFYAKTFPDSSVGAIQRAPGDYPSGSEGDVLVVEFTVAGIPCIGLNGGPAFKHDEAFSFQIMTEDQEETDRYWNAIVGNGGQESMCGWCKDKWGVSWQITPRVLLEAMSAGGAEAKRAFDAMMTMQKLDVAEIEKARRG
jgi:predicted 3-demethylubiquinone-9 3-methyltransferase (glyoxalase superfamily)